MATVARLKQETARSGSLLAPILSAGTGSKPNRPALLHQAKVDAIEDEHEEREWQAKGQVAFEGDRMLGIVKASALFRENNASRGRRDQRAAARTNPPTQRPGGGVRRIEGMDGHRDL